MSEAMEDSNSGAARLVSALVAGCAVGTLGGLIGLGGAEFRLPLLIGLFGFAALHAVILNKAMSLFVVASALVFRSTSIPFIDVTVQWPIILNLLAGSLAGAWLGASWASKMRGRTLYQVLAVMLVGIAIVLLFGHGHASREPMVTGVAQLIAGVVAGFGIGVVASIMGVAGGELLIPTLVLLFGVDIKLAGSLSLAVSLPTMVVGFARYSQDQAFGILRTHKRFVLAMAVGSIAGAAIGGNLLGVIPSSILLPGLAAILLISSVKVWRHK
ncbi:sulfite exporter TauE/SafE family protein [Comamonas sp. F1-6]|uniref:sulfite exporter TauE/SafE family protein n=1 Tax=Comamonas sp. F1-6 TaxID=673550 RepID=UPI0031CE015D